MPTRYDHPNVIVTREDRLGLSVVGTTSVTTFRLGFQKARLKAVHFFPVIAGTDTDFTQTIRTISGVTTTSVGIATTGTLVAGLAASAVAIALGAANTPPGVDVEANSQLTLTNAVDGDGQNDIMVEFEVLPDAVQT